MFVWYYNFPDYIELKITYLCVYEDSCASLDSFEGYHKVVFNQTMILSWNLQSSSQNLFKCRLSRDSLLNLSLILLTYFHLILHLCVVILKVWAITSLVLFLIESWNISGISLIFLHLISHQIAPSSFAGGDQVVYLSSNSVAQVLKI